MGRLASQLAQGKQAPRKKRPSSGPPAAPVKLSEACRTVPPKFCAMNAIAIPATPYTSAEIYTKCSFRFVDCINEYANDVNTLMNLLMSVCVLFEYFPKYHLSMSSHVTAVTAPSDDDIVLSAPANRLERKSPGIPCR